MEITDKIIKKIKSLPKDKQAEVLDFVNFLEKKVKENGDKFWYRFSLESAIQGMENEEPLYTLNDLKETFE